MSVAFYLVHMKTTVNPISTVRPNMTINFNDEMINGTITTNTTKSILVTGEFTT